MSRNEAEIIAWQLDINEFENYCRTINVLPSTLLQPNRTEIRIRRGAKYLCGGKLLYRSPRITPVSQDIELKASGFLNLFQKRYTEEERVFTGVQATTIAATLITESQGQGPMVFRSSRLH